MRRSGLAAAVLLAPYLASAGQAAPPGVSAEEVRRACQQGKGCTDRDGELAAFCRLASAVPPDPAAWRSIAWPVPATVAGVAACKPEPVVRAADATGTALFTGQRQSNLLWGAADFLVGRAEEELRAWAVDRFLRKVCDGPEGTLGGEPLFRETCRVVKAIHLRGFFGGMGVLRAAMRTDLQRLPTLGFAEAVRRADEKVPGELDAALVAWEAARTVERVLAGDSPLAAFAGLATDRAARPLTCDGTRAAALVFQASALSRTLSPLDGSSALTLPDGPGWIPPLMALAVNHAQDPAIAGGWPACAAGGTAGFEVDRLYALTAGLQAALKRAGDASGALRAAGADRAQRIQAYGRLASASVALLRAATAAGGTDARAHDRTLSAVEDLAGDLAAGSYSTMVLKLSGALAAGWAQKRWPAEFARYSAFGADVAEAQTAEAASAAIARAAEPVGGYRRKRTARGGYLGVNGYLGFGGGLEWAKPGDTTRPRAGWEAGFWAPVGLEGGFASRGGWSFGLLVQAVDLGVLASWRFKNSDLSAAPQVSFRQVLAPGGFVVVGLPRAPIALSLGAELAPRLREVSSGTPGVIDRDRDAVRLQAAVAVDIPIFY